MSAAEEGGGGVHGDEGLRIIKKKNLKNPTAETSFLPDRDRYASPPSGADLLEAMPVCSYRIMRGRGVPKALMMFVGAALVR